MEVLNHWIRRVCIVCVYFAYLSITDGNCKTIQEIARTNEDLEKTLDFMRKYAYVGEQMNSQVVNSYVDPAEFEETVRQMQRYMPNVEVTGVLDDATLAMMDNPRCGVPDPSGNGDETLGGRLRRYTHSGGMWPNNKPTITYRVVNTPLEMGLDDVRDAVRRAFDVWQKQIPRTFTEIFSGTADIMLSFGEYYHGDPYPFDGPSGTLAHAFGPYAYGTDPLEGDVHFDDAEFFTIRTPQGINLFLVAAHEIGHSLGLGHSTDSTALMAPFYSGYQPNFQLPYDDVLGIQTLYGSRPPPEVTMRPTTTTEEAKTTELPLICQMSFDSIAFIRGEIFAFKDDRFWRVREPGNPLSPPDGYLSATFFKDLPPGVQAAYERYFDQKILFFKGKEYWVYDGLNPLPGYPRPIANMSEMLPGNLQAALSYDEYNKLYLFKRGRVYRYDEFLKEVDAGFPHPINSVFPGVPKGIDAAFRLNDGMTYFVKGKFYWRYNDLTRKVDDGYPRPFVADFFGCNPDLYPFKGVNNTDYDAFGMDTDEDGNNGGNILQFSLVFHAILLILISAIVPS